MCKLPHRPGRRRKRRSTRAEEERAMRWVSTISRGRAAALAIVVAAAMVGACGGDDDNAGGGATTGASTSAAAAKPSGSTTAGGAGAKSVSDYQAYVGGKPGKADSSKSPVYIGWVNQQGGQQEIGGAATDGADLAVKVVNEQLGGIDGHPVVLKKCFIKNAEEEGNTCGQRLGNDKSG